MSTDNLQQELRQLHKIRLAAERALYKLTPGSVVEEDLYEAIQDYGLHVAREAGKAKYDAKQARLSNHGCASPRNGESS